MPKYRKNKEWNVLHFTTKEAPASKHQILVALNENFIEEKVKRIDIIDIAVMPDSGKYLNSIYFAFTEE